LQLTTLTPYSASIVCSTLELSRSLPHADTASAITTNTAPDSALLLLGRSTTLDTSAIIVFRSWQPHRPATDGLLIVGARKT